MQNGAQNGLDPVESALLELRDAENAGVFRPTRPAFRSVPAAASARGTTYRLGLRYLAPVAAVIVLAFGVWSWMFASHLADLKQRSVMTASSDPSSPLPVDQIFQQCFKGPASGGWTEECRRHDRDGDGDVDLADFGALQLAAARPTP